MQPVLFVKPSPILIVLSPRFSLIQPRKQGAQKFSFSSALPFFLIHKPCYILYILYLIFHSDQIEFLTAYHDLEIIFLRLFTFHFDDTVRHIIIPTGFCLVKSVSDEEPWNLLSIHAHPISAFFLAHHIQVQIFPVFLIGSCLMEMNPFSVTCFDGYFCFGKDACLILV